MKDLFRWNKKYFSVFKRLSYGEKIKRWQKIVGTSFKGLLLSQSQQKVKLCMQSANASFVTNLQSFVDTSFLEPHGKYKLCY